MTISRKNHPLVIRALELGIFIPPSVGGAMNTLYRNQRNDRDYRSTQIEFDALLFVVAALAKYTADQEREAV